MNKRSIALGAGVIALALAAPGSAEAGVLGGSGSVLPDTNVSVNVQANAKPSTGTNVKANVKAKADVPAPRLPKRPQTDGGPQASVKVGGDAKSTGSGVGTGLNARAGAGTDRVDGRAWLRQDAGLKGISLGHTGKGAIAADANGGLKLTRRSHHHNSAAVNAKGGARVKATAHAPAMPSVKTPTSGSQKGGLPLRGIGREVGNPIQLTLAGWLIALTAAACLGASRMVRRLQRNRL